MVLDQRNRYGTAIYPLLPNILRRPGVTRIEGSRLPGAVLHRDRVRHQVAIDPDYRVTGRDFEIPRHEEKAAYLYHVEVPAADRVPPPSS